MSEGICESSALCNEKFKVYDKEIDGLKANLGKLTDSVNEIDKKTDTLDSNLTGKLNQMETKFDIYNSMTFKKLEELERKIDKINTCELTSASKKQQDSFKDWLEQIGKKMIEYGMLSGILYGVGKGINLF